MCWAVNVRVVGMKLITEALDVVKNYRVVGRLSTVLGANMMA